MKFLEKYPYLLTIVLFVLLGRMGFASMDSVAPPNVTVVGDRISVRAMGVPLGDLLKAIERKTGIQFEVDGGILEEKMFVDLAELPLSQGIKKIIPSLNHAIVYGPSGKIRKVVLIGQGRASGTISVTRKGVDSSTISDHSPWIVQLEASPKGSEAEKGPLSRTEKPAIEAPPGAHSVEHQAPPGSDITVIKGPPGADSVGHQPPPDSHITVIDGPPEGGPPPPMAPPDSTQPSEKSQSPSQKGG